MDGSEDRLRRGASASKSINTRPNKRENGVLVVMLVAISITFGWILWPFFGAILWAVLLSVVFMPWYRLLLARMPQRPNLATGAVVLLIALLVVLPLTLVAAALHQEISGLVERFQSGELDPQRSLLEFRSSLPEWAAKLLAQFEVTASPPCRRDFRPL